MCIFPLFKTSCCRPVIIRFLKILFYAVALLDHRYARYCCKMLTSVQSSRHLLCLKNINITMYRYISIIESCRLQIGENYNNANLKRMYMTINKNKCKEYEGRKLIGFSMEQIYNVVADVSNYKLFVPFCKKSDILSKSDGCLKASLDIGFPPINESYTSKVTTIFPRLVKAECTDGKLFNHLNTLWVFSPGLKNNAQTCVIDFSLSFEFKSVIHSQLSNLFFNEIVRQMENAFIEEAKKRYGRPCIKAVRLER